MKFFRNLPRDTLDAAHGLHIELLRRELNGSITRMDTGIFDVFADGISNDFTILSHSIHFHLFCMLDERTYYYRVLL